MSNRRISGLRSVQLGVSEIERSADFYTRIWGLLPVAAANGERSFRASGVEHHVLHLMKRDAPELLGVTLAAPDAAAVDTLHTFAIEAGLSVLHAPRELPAITGGGYGVTFIGPEGLRVTASSGVTEHQRRETDASRPQVLTHVVINTAQMESQMDFFLRFLGFRLSDSTDAMRFLRCASDHHTIALAKGARLSLNHAAFLMRDIDGLMYGAGRLIDSGREIEWGLGRHGPGSNVFAYFIDPDGFVVEYTTEMEQVDDSYVARDAAYWSSFPRRPCRWGVARRPSARLMAAMAGNLNA